MSNDLSDEIELKKKWKIEIGPALKKIPPSILLAASGRFAIHIPTHIRGSKEITGISISLV